MAALHDATGKQIRRIPLKPAYVRELMKGWGRIEIPGVMSWMGYYFAIMKASVLPVLILLACATALHGAENISCKAGEEDASILHVHGRLMVYNGGYPNLRLWQIGTNHLFGIFSDPADLRCIRSGTCNLDQDTNLPSNLEHLNLVDFATYGDFEIRTLEPFRPGHQQAACIVDVHRIVRRGTH